MDSLDGSGAQPLESGDQVHDGIKLVPIIDVDELYALVDFLVDVIDQGTTDTPDLALGGIQRRGDVITERLQDGLPSGCVGSLPVVRCA